MLLHMFDRPAQRHGDSLVRSMASRRRSERRPEQRSERRSELRSVNGADQQRADLRPLRLYQGTLGAGESNVAAFEGAGGKGDRSLDLSNKARAEWIHLKALRDVSQRFQPSCIPFLLASEALGRAPARMKP